MGPETGLKKVETSTADRNGRWGEIIFPAEDRRPVMGVALKRDAIDWNQLVAVHMTDTIPELSVGRGEIHPTFFYRWRGAAQIGKYSCPREDEKIHQVVRQSIHFTLNHVVESHTFGDWEKKKVAIIIPADSIKQHFVALNPIDSWCIGKMPVPPGSVVIAETGTLPKGYRIPGVELREVLPGMVYDEAKKTITQLGFTRIHGGVNHLPDENLQHAFSVFAQRSGLESSLHFYSASSTLDRSMALLQIHLAERVRFTNDPSRSVTVVLSDNLTQTIDDYFRIHIDGPFKELTEQCSHNSTDETKQALVFLEKAISGLKDRVLEAQQSWAKHLERELAQLRIEVANVGSRTELDELSTNFFLQVELDPRNFVGRSGTSRSLFNAFEDYLGSVKDSLPMEQIDKILL